MIFVSETVGFVLLIYKYIFFSHIFVTVSDVPPARELPGGSWTRPARQAAKTLPTWKEGRDRETAAQTVRPEARICPVSGERWSEWRLHFIGALLTPDGHHTTVGGDERLTDRCWREGTACRRCSHTVGRWWWPCPSKPGGLQFGRSESKATCYLVTGVSPKKKKDYWVFTQ